MCHYLGGGLHGRQKRVKAQSESSKSVVNSVLISREMPVFPGFLEIIRVVLSILIIFSLLEISPQPILSIIIHKFIIEIELRTIFQNSLHISSGFANCISI